MLRKARWVLRHQDVMLLADREMPAHELMGWLRSHGTTACAYRVMCSCMVLDAIQLWLARCIRRSLKHGCTAMWGCGSMGYIVVTWFYNCGSVRYWAVDEPPTFPLAICLEVSRGRIILDSKSGAFQLEDSECAQPPPSNGCI